MAHPVEARADLTEHAQPGQPVGVGQIDILLTITARCDMVKAPGKFKSQWA